ncbi:unnamed protein product [Lactuca saligna]|uniref:RNA helicase n=1 Tax=Lactuca saligna TaxID=75948 RepID=A0AA35ZFC6_LACSI|nr:unnamed protein product [Lactuca saligna]
MGFLHQKRLKSFNGIKGYARIIEQNGKRDAKKELLGFTRRSLLEPCVNLKICDEKHLYMFWLKTLGEIVHHRDKPAMRVVYQGASVHQRLLVSSEVARRYEPGNQAKGDVLHVLFCCFDPILTIVAGLSVRDPFLLTQEKKDVSNPATFTQGHFGLFLISFVCLFHHASTAISRFSAKDYSDHMALVDAYEGWKEAEREGYAYEYCWRNFLSAQTLQAMHSIRHQFIHILKDAQLLETKLGINTSSYTFFKESHRIRCISRVWNHVSCEGSLYTWELSSGAKLVYLTHYRGSIVSCLMADDSGSSGVFCSGCGFDWPASPSTESMVRSLEVLYSLGVLDDDPKLTSPVGFQVAELPLDPMVSKMIIASDKLECLEEIITIATILSVQRELDEAKLRFVASEGISLV